MAFVKNPNPPFPERFKPDWRDILELRVAIYRRLPEDLTADLEALIPWFIDKIEWSAHGAVTLTEEMKVCVAAEACLLIVRRSKDDYKQLRRVKFSPRDLSTFGEESKWAGDASRTIVRMGWYWTQIGMEDGEDNYNLTIHEYAHVLDAAHDGKSEASIKLGDYKTTREWLKFAKESYKRLCRLWDRDAHYKEPVIRKYGTTNMAEFFACATEAFFEVSRQLRLAEPDIYKWMKIIYGMDPAQWRERVDYRDLDELQSSYADTDRERKRKEADRRRMVQEAIRRYEREAREREEARRKSEKEKQCLEKERRELEENGIKKALEDIEQAHKKKLEEINRRYEDKVVQLDRRIRDAEVKFERDKKEAEQKLERQLSRIKWNLEKALAKLKAIEEEKPVKPKLEEIEEPEIEITRRGPKRRTVSRFHPGGLPSLKFTVVGHLKDGLFLRWDEEGDLREEMHYHLGEKNGLCTYYYPGGSKELEGNYVNDQRAGIWMGWYCDGKVKHKSKYLSGELVEWTKYMPDGSVQKFKKPGKLDKAFSKY